MCLLVIVVIVAPIRLLHLQKSFNQQNDALTWHFISLPISAFSGTTYAFWVWIFVERFFSPETCSALDTRRRTFSFPWCPLPIVLYQQESTYVIYLFPSQILLSVSHNLTLILDNNLFNYIHTKWLRLYLFCVLVHTRYIKLPALVHLLDMFCERRPFSELSIVQLIKKIDEPNPARRRKQISQMNTKKLELYF